MTEQLCILFIDRGSGAFISSEYVREGATGRDAIVTLSVARLDLLL